MSRWKDDLLPVFKDFLDSESGYAKSTLQNRQSGLSKFQEWLEMKGKNVDECGGRELTSWFGWMEREGHPDLVRSDYLSQVRQFYNWYWMDKDVENPADKVKTSQLDYEPEHDKPTLEPREVRMLINSAVSKRGEALLAFMASTGARVGEAVQVRLDQIDLEDRRVDDLPTIKTDVAPRTIWFDREARRKIEDYINGGYRDKHAGESDYLFVSYGERQEHMSTDRARVEFQRAVDNCDALADKLDTQEIADGRERRNFTTHILRRSFCQAWVDNGGDLMSLKNQVGWKNLETAKEYLDDEVSKGERDDYGPTF